MSLVDLGDRSLLAADHRGEVAEVVGRERDVRGECLPHRLAVLPALRDRQQLEVVLDHVRDLVQDARALGGRGLAPGVLGSMRRVERELDVLRGRARHLRERLARRGRHVRRVPALHRSDPVAADEVLVARLQLDGTVDLSRSREGHNPLNGRHDSPSVRLYQPQVRLPCDDRSHGGAEASGVPPIRLAGNPQPSREQHGNRSPRVLGYGVRR